MGDWIQGKSPRTLGGRITKKECCITVAYLMKYHRRYDRKQDQSRVKGDYMTKKRSYDNECTDQKYRVLFEILPHYLRDLWATQVIQSFAVGIASSLAADIGKPQFSQIP